MRIPRLYQPTPLSLDAEIELNDRARQHAVQVLRLKQNAPLILFNGEGGEYEAVLTTVNKRHASAQVQRFNNVNNESPLTVQLGLGISKGERMDYAIQKAVELGVMKIMPLFSERCVVQLDAKRLQKRLQHWQGVIISACEQCGRNQLPTIATLQSLEQWLEGEHEGLELILSPTATKGLNALTPMTTNIRLSIGPEGGFSEREIQQAIKAGFSEVCMGPRVLRTETAVVAALAAVQTLWGDLSV